MSLLPHVIKELLDNESYYNPLSSLYDQNFGLGLWNDSLRRPMIAGYVRPLRHIHSEPGLSSVTNQRDNLKVSLDVQQFKPEEINVKIADGYLVVDAKHEEKQDKHGFISRQFTRRYKLPENVNLEAIQSNLSSDGILTIDAPKKLEENEAKEIPIPVVVTNQPAIKQTKPAEEKPTGEKMEA